MKFIDYYQGVVEKEESPKDLTSYCEAKAQIIEDVLMKYTDHLNRIFEVADINNDSIEKATESCEVDQGLSHDVADRENSPGEMDNNSMFGQLDDAVLIALFKEFHKEEYEPPAGNLVGIQIHLTGLWLFYGAIQPDEIAFSSILKLDIASLHLVSIASSAIEMMKEGEIKINRIGKVKNAKRLQKKKSADEILEAYMDLGVEYLPASEKKPFLFMRTPYAYEGMARQIMFQHGVELSVRQIARHLRDLVEKRQI